MGRLKFQAPQAPTDEEQTFVRVMETYKDVSIATLCTLVFAQPYTDVLERRLRKIREKYHNFKLNGIVPIGRIIKTTHHTGAKHYKLVQENDIERYRIHLSIELDLVCAAIEKHNTRKIWGDIQYNGQQYLVEDIDKLIEYQEWLEKEINK